MPKPKDKPKQKQQQQRTTRREPARNTTSARSNLNRIGALWLGKTKNGRGFMSGRIELTENQEIRVLVFKNDYKEEQGQPDYIIYEPESSEEQANRNKAAQDWKKGDDDIPF